MSTNTASQAGKPQLDQHKEFTRVVADTGDFAALRDSKCGRGAGVGRVRLLTISPNLLRELKDSYAPVERKIHPEVARQSVIERVEVDEKAFRWMLNEDAMATEKLAEGIRLFADDARKLEQLITEKLSKT